MGQLVLGIAGAGLGMLTGIPGGASIGWMLGGMAWNLLDPQKIQGPRLQDTKVKGADYGVMRPIVYGTVRIGGIGMGQGSTSEGPNKFTEHEESSGGKGGPEITNYRYTLSWFDELCEGPIEGVLRRWSNGRLINEQGQDNPSYAVTVYLGNATQMPDPTMETIYGVGEVSPMRGVAYEVVEEADVTETGNARPIVEREVHTTPITANLRIVRSNYATGRWAVMPETKPIIVDWPDSGDIVVSGPSVEYTWAVDLVIVTRHDGNTFDVVGSAVSSDNPRYIFPRDDGFPSGGHWGVGIYYPDPSDTSTVWGLWRLNSNEDIDPGVIIHVEKIYGDIDTFPAPSNFLLGAGITATHHMSGCALTQDGTAFYVFTVGPVGDMYWWKIVGYDVVDSGTVSPAFNIFAYGVAVGHGLSTATMSAENNGEYFWYIGPGQNGVIVFRIDPATKVFSAFTTAEFIIPWNLPNNELSRASIKALPSAGYAGAVYEDSMVLMSRLGPPGPVILGDIVKDLLQRADRRLTDAQIDVSDLTQEVRGFIVGSQMTAKNAIDILRRAFFFDVTECDGKLLFVNRGHSATDTIPDEDLCAHVPGTDKPDPLETVRVPEAELPRTVFINFYNVDNDYQQGSQYCRRTVTSSQSDVTLDLPVCFTATEALQRAQWHLHFAWLERDRFTFYVTDEWCKLRPTNVVVVRGVNIRLTNVTEMPDGVIRCEGVRAFAGPYTSPITDPGSGGADDGEIPGDGGSGQPPQEPPTAKADTAFVLIDGPLTSEADSATGLRAAIYKDSAGSWPGASLMKSVDGGTTYAAVAATSTGSVVGTVAAALADFGGGNVIDRSNVIRAAMANSGTLSSTTEAGLQNGLNLIALGSAATGWELLQYQTATLVAPGVYDLSGLLRGRFGTEWRMGTHSASEILIVWSSTIAVPGAPAEIGLSRKYKGVTNGMAVADATAVDFTNTGVALKAWAPVLLGHGVNGSGDVILTCVPRRRGSGGWPDGVDLPATDPANWQWEIATDAAFTSVVRAIGTTITEATYTAAMQTTDLGSTGTPFYWRVAQFSALGLGYFAEATA